MNTATVDPFIGHLPQAAQKKLAHLKRIETRARAMADGLQAEYEKGREALAEAQADLARFDRRHGHRVPDDDPARKALANAVNGAKEELRRIGEERAGAGDPGFRYEEIEAWLRAHAKAKFKVVDTKVRLAKGEKASEALERIRERQREVRERLAAVANAPRPRAELRQAFRDQVNALASRGAPQVLDDGSIEWPLTQVVTVAEGTAAAASVPDALGLIAWLARDELAKRLDTELAKLPEAPDAMSAEKQREAITQGQATLLQLQREGESLAEMLSGDGIFVRRDRDLPIPVLLGIEATK